ncbi:MAG: DUF2948 family protein [Pseudomonadota bacterium]
MTEDARFEDAPFTDQPLKLRAETSEDLDVISTLCQDAVVKSGDIRWLKRARRLVLLLHRFRWEDEAAAARAKRPFERVQSVVTISDVTAVKARGIAPDQVQSVLGLNFEPGEDGAGRLSIACAGGADLAVEVECLDLTLADLTQPWEARSAAAPSHPD